MEVRVREGGWRRRGERVRERERVPYPSRSAEEAG